ncbi:MAG TPA: M28 family peptidase [Verrucomicrobiales bacterium]|nr:M28 family peptidase [Verrucomicrobiales bacterium]
MTQRHWIKGALIGLPAGLVVLGVIWMWYLIENPEDPVVREPARRVTLPPVEAADVERYVRALSEDIGPRHADLPGSVRIAVNYLESTLGPRNIGCVVQRQPLGAEGSETGVWENVVVEIAGRGRAEEIVVVGAHYDTAPGSPGANCDGTGVAAVLCLARVWVGALPQRTLRLVLFGNGASGDPQRSGAAVYAANCRQKEERIACVLLLSGLGAVSEGGPATWPENLKPYLPETAEALVFGGASGAGDLVNLAADAFDEAGEIAAQRLVADEAPDLLGSAELAAWGSAEYPALVVTDMAQFRAGFCGTAQDLPHTVDFSRVTEVVRALDAVVRRLVDP